MSILVRRRRHAVPLACLTAAVTAAAVIVPAAPAAAVALPPRLPCTAANHNEIFYDVTAAEVNPTITHFMSINITEGTTGERTETLTVINEVTTSLGASVTYTAEWGPAFAKVSLEVGFEVQRTTSSTRQETTTMRWTFNQPGYYGLYKGTRAVSGSIQRWRCAYQPVLGRGAWWNMGAQSYVTFANMEAGTIQCGDPVPDGSLRQRARMQLGC